MTKHVGKVYQEIRIAKGLKQGDIVGNYISRQNLSSFENGKHIPKYDTMLFLVRQINMTLEEFHYICNQYETDPRNQIIHDFDHTFMSLQISDLERLKEKCKTYLRDQNDDAIQEILTLTTILLNEDRNPIEESKQSLHKLIQKVWKRLELADTWYLSELRTLQCLLFTYDTEYLYMTGQQILDRLNRYQNFHKGQHLLLNLYTRLSSIYLHHGQFENCLQFSNSAVVLSKKMKYYHIHAFHQIRVAICTGNLAHIDKYLDLLRITEETDLLKNIQFEIQKFRE